MIQNNLNKDLERKIDLYINGRLSSDEIDELWTELIQDDYHLDYMKSMANLKAIIEEKRENERNTSTFQIRKYASYVAAAAVVLFVGVLGVMNYNTSNVTPVSPLDEIGLDIVRSEVGVSANITNETVKQAIQLAADGKTSEAKDLLTKEIENQQEPKLLAELSLTLGSIQYNLGEYNDALSSFTTVIDQGEASGATLEKGYWLLGNTYFQLDRLEEAQTAFQKAYDLDGQYSRIAMRYINALEAMEK